MSILQPKEKPTTPKPEIKPLGQNPIEDAIGDRVQTPETPSPSKMSEQSKQELRNLPIPQDLEALNQETEERLLNNDDPTAITDEFPPTVIISPEVRMKMLEMQTPVSKPDPQPAIKTSTQESQPPQKVDRITAWQCPDCGVLVRDKNLQGLPCFQHRESSAGETDTPEGQTVSDIIKDKMENTKPFLDNHQQHLEAEKHFKKTDEKLGIPKIENVVVANQKQNRITENTLQMNCKHCVPVDDKDLVALKNYILSNGFVVAMVAMHIRMLCTSAMTTPSTTDWDFEDRVHIPDLVLAMLRQPGYLEGIWPSLSIIMNTNKANPAWTAGISMTIAFFDVIRTLPMLKELKNEEKS